MITEEQLLSRFRNRAVRLRGRATYFPVAVAEEVLDSCRTHALALVGIEGNRIEGERVYTLSDRVYDLSRRRASNWTQYAQGCNADAAEVLRKLRSFPDLALWLTILNEDDWRATGAAG